MGNLDPKVYLDFRPFKRFKTIISATYLFGGLEVVYFMDFAWNFEKRTEREKVWAY